MGFMDIAIIQIKQTTNKIPDWEAAGPVVSAPEDFLSGILFGAQHKPPIVLLRENTNEYTPKWTVKRFLPLWGKPPRWGVRCWWRRRGRGPAGRRWCESAGKQRSGQRELVGNTKKLCLPETTLSQVPTLNRKWGSIKEMHHWLQLSNTD